MGGSVALSSTALAAIEIFAGLHAPALEAAFAFARIRHLRQETRIFRQGDRADRAHALLKGSVRISQVGSDGAEVVIRFIGPGEMFGTVALFTDRRYPADAVTLSDAVEISWSEQALLRLVDEYPRVAMNVIRIIGTRLKEAQERLRELSTQSVERRIAHAVLRLARQAGHDTLAGTAIEFRLRRKDVAEISGATLYTASRILTAWERAGLLVSKNQRLTIRKLSELKLIAEESERTDGSGGTRGAPHR